MKHLSSGQGEGEAGATVVWSWLSSSLGVSSYGGKWKGLDPQSLVLAGLTHDCLLDSLVFFMGHSSLLVRASWESYGERFPIDFQVGCLQRGGGEGLSGALADSSSGLSWNPGAL